MVKDLAKCAANDGTAQSLLFLPLLSSNERLVFFLFSFIPLDLLFSFSLIPLTLNGVTG